MSADRFHVRPDTLQRARMETGSMFPLVPIGSTLFFVPPDRIRPGDLVVFGHNRGWFCHRVVSVDNELVHTWGDWTLIPDPPHRKADIVARCAVLVRKGVLVDLEWPAMRVAARITALVLPRLKRALFGQR